jgi:predicted ATPase
MPEDFPDYINVSAAGPIQINDYEELGYELVVLTD